MRIKDTDILNRRVKERSYRRRYFLAFEGSTEYDYFEGVRECREKLGIKNQVEIYCIDRFDQNSGDSNPSVIIDPFKEYMHLIRTGECSVRIFVGMIVQHIFDDICKQNDGKSKRECGRKLHRFQTVLIRELTVSEYSAGDLIIDGKEKEATEFCRNLAKENYSGYYDSIFIPKKIDPSLCYEENDVICLIVDRDCKSFTSEQYSAVRRMCDESNVSLYVTTPAFEFWLILHFDECRKYDENVLNNIFKNEKNSVNEKERRYCECLLMDLLGGEYSKTDIQFESRFCDRIDNAIENVESFKTDLQTLEGKIGSNLGDLIKRIRENR